MFKNTHFFCTVCLLLLSLFCLQTVEAQIKTTFPVSLKWGGVAEERNSYDTLLYIVLESGNYDGPMPTYMVSLPVFDDQLKVDAALESVESAPLSAEELRIAEHFSYDAEFMVSARPVRARDEAFLVCEIIPFRQIGGNMEKLVSAQLSLTLVPDTNRTAKAADYARSSAMATGKWYKVGLQETGVYKLTYNDLKELGVELSGLDPRTIRIYHNGGGVLPELNSEPRHDDLVEVSVYVYGESDGKFDPDDYILFYGRGPVGWKYNALHEAFEHRPNAYDDYSYAFVVTGLGNGKRIGEAVLPVGNADVTVSEFLDRQLYEAKDYNLNGTGRTYYGDIMDGTVSKSYNFSFPNAVTSRRMSLVTSLAGRNFKPATFEVYVDDNKLATYNLTSTTSTSNTYACAVGGWVHTFPKGETVDVKLRHVATATSTSTGYVDYMALNVWRQLKFAGQQMLFRNPEADKSSTVYEYRLSGASQQVQVWNVTDAVAPSVVKGQLNVSVFSFHTFGNQNNEFVAFNGNDCFSVRIFGEVANQNLHGIRDVDYLIVTYPDFMAQAEQLKAIHAGYNPDLNVFITTPELIYNEFACGAKDITAIRDFCRMLYLDSSAGRALKYLLLLGDCSYDHKNRSGVVDLVPSFESEASLDMQSTYVSDDYFGFFDENEGALHSSIADIGIGRFPVTTAEQADQMVDKIERYIAKDQNTMQPWRNVFTFFTDDEKSFVQSAEEFVKQLKLVGGEDVVTDKIYLGAYTQVSSPNGEICPEMNEAINNRMEKGTLVLTYTGHGGEVQLAEEKILQRKDVDSWRNAPMYPLMITGTCEFSRFDDHKRTSLGEYSFLNPYGGMIAMFTTSRVTHGDHNRAFIREIFKRLFEINGGEYHRLGDIYRMAKTLGTVFEKRYVFFGDPALRLAYPKWTVETEYMSDTIRALQPVEIEGVVKDLDGQVASGFNGVVHVTVYDKEIELTATNYETNGDITTSPFNLRNSIVFNGKTQVKDGRFKIEFIVPRDISYSYGTGMVSYYATDYNIDAHGSSTNFIIGGFNDDAETDNDPPEIRLFIDDTLFVSGGITGESPLLLAYVEDESGINTTGAGIGHDIMATLTGPTRVSYCLNDYFTSEIDQQGKGTIAYKMLNLPDGDYTLTLKVWDVYNNSSTATIDFTVMNSSGMCLENPSAAPNPVLEGTAFTFDHNQMGRNMKVQIDIFDIMGRRVTQLTETVAGTSARTTPIRWNGCGAHGERLQNGVYVYRIIATNDKGETASVVSRLVLTK